MYIFQPILQHVKEKDTTETPQGLFDSTFAKTANYKSTLTDMSVSI